MMKKSSTLFLIAFYSLMMAQVTPPVVRSSTFSISNGLTINSRKSVLIEKQILDFGKFKNLNIQKIVSKDLSDNSVENVLGIITEYETYDHISKRTLTITKNELLKLIQALETLVQKEAEKIKVETKYKFTTVNNIEFGAVYNRGAEKWINYIKMPSAMYSQNLSEYSREELKELITLLKKVEKQL